MAPQPEINRLEAGKVIAFARNIELVGQSRKSRLVSHVMADMAYTEPGDRFTDELMGLSEPQDCLGDIEPTPGEVVEQYRRVHFFKTYNDGKWVGTRDKAEKLVDPTNSTVQAMGAGRERRRDITIIGAPGKMGGLFGDAWQTDENGDQEKIAFPGANKIAYNFNGLWLGKADGAAAPGAAPTVLTPQKMRQAKIILDKSEYAEMDNDLPIIAVEETDLQNLQTSAEMNNKDYTSHDLLQIERLVAGDISVFKGFRFVKVRNSLLPKVPGQSDRWYVPVWFKSAMLYKERPLVTTRVTERADYKYRWHAYYEAQDACMRREDAAVCWIEVTR